MAAREIHERDIAAPIAMEPGDEVTLVLSENGSTGYRWALESSDRTVVDLTSSSSRPGAAGVGAAGERRFTLVALAPGHARVSLKLWRAWQGEASVQRRAAFDVSVKPV